MGDENEKRSLLKKLERIIMNEFHDAMVVGGCLAASFLFYEQAQLFTKDVYILCGHAENRSLKIFTHFWCIDRNGTVYDPMTLLNHEFTDVDPSEWSYKPTPNLDNPLMKIVYSNFLKTKSTENYFNAAPKYLQDIRLNVQKNCKELMGKL
jgi:hypothetical protein